MIKALGIIGFASDATNCGLMEQSRTVGSFSFLGRYRVIDFPISNMSNSGLSKVQVFVRKKPRSIVNHLGSGRQFNFNSKQGGLSVYFGEREHSSELFNTDIACYYDNLPEIMESKFPYVIITAGNIISRLNFEEILDEHIKKGSDITIAYKFSDDATREYINCDTISLSKEKQVTQISRNHGIYKTRNISLETYVLSKELFVELVKDAHELSQLYWFRDIINEKLNNLDVKGYAYRGPVYIINSFNAYYQANIDLIHLDKASDLLRKDWPVYTRTNDSVPAQYGKDADVKHSLISNGSHIKGTVINSVIGRGCIIEEGAVVKNSVILPGSYIGKNVIVDYIVADKKSNITKVKEVIGSKDDVIYVPRGSKI